MRSFSMRSGAAVAGVALVGLQMSGGVRAGGMEPQNVAAPIEVTVDHAVVPAGATVTLTGRTTREKSGSVRVKIAGPNGLAAVVAASVSSSGGYRATFSRTTAIGAYGVTAVAQDGRGTATTSFSVSSPGGGADDAISAASDGDTAVASAVAEMKSEVTTLPPSPARDTMVAKIGTIESDLGGAPQRLAAMRQALEKMASLEASRPETSPSIDEVLERVDDDEMQTREATRRLDAALSASKAKGVVCEDLNAVVEVMNAASNVLNFNGKIGAIAHNLIVDKGWSDGLYGRLVTKIGSSDNAKALFGEYIKAGDAAFTAGGAYFNFGLGLVVDAAQFAASNVFTSYCEKYSGPIAIDARAEFTNEGRYLWRYSERMQGTLTLRFAKSAARQATHVVGEFVGSATNFTLDDNFLQMNPRLARYEYAHADWPPIAGPVQAAVNDSVGTLVAGALSPTSFWVPVEGDIANGKLTLRVEPARADFDKLQGRAFYVFVEPLVPVPSVQVHKTPYVGAYFLITRTFGTTRTVDISTDPKGSSFVVTRHRDAKPASDVDVHFDLSLKACDPGC